MPSEREIKKLYVNGRTIGIEFFFCLFKFSASAGRAAVTEGGDLGGLGVIPQQAFWRVETRQNRKHVHVCIACYNEFDHETMLFIVLYITMS